MFSNLSTINIHKSCLIRFSIITKLLYSHLHYMFTHISSLETFYFFFDLRLGFLLFLFHPYFLDYLVIVFFHNIIRIVSIHFICFLLLITPVTPGISLFIVDFIRSSHTARPFILTLLFL